LIYDKHLPKDKVSYIHNQILSSFFPMRPPFSRIEAAALALLPLPRNPHASPGFLTGVVPRQHKYVVKKVLMDFTALSPPHRHPERIFVVRSNE
jgi:hypothetical protein